MYINYQNISDFKASLIDRDISENSSSSGVSWEAGTASPIERGIQRGFKSISLVFLFKCEDDNDFYMNKSRLLKELLSCNITFSDLEFNYRCWLDGIDSNEKIRAGVYKTTVNLLCDYGRGPAKTYQETDTTGFTVENLGTHTTTVYLKITSNKITENIKINGFSEPITITGLPEGDSIYIDSQTGEITNLSGDNYFKYYNAWSLPYLEPGNHYISLSTGCDVELSFYELY